MAHILHVDIGSYFDPSKILTQNKGLKLLEIHDVGQTYCRRFSRDQSTNTVMYVYYYLEEGVVYHIGGS